MDTTSRRGVHSEGPQQAREGPHHAASGEAHSFGSGITLVGIFTVSVVALAIVFYTFPHLEK